MTHIYDSLSYFYSEDVHTSPLKEQNIQTRPNDYILSIKEIVNGVSVDNEEKNYEATQSARKMLSRERNPPIDDVINVSISSMGAGTIFKILNSVWHLASPGSISIT